MATRVNRHRPSVSWDTNPTYIRIESRDDSPSIPAIPQQALAHNPPQQLPRTLPGMYPADPRAYQQQSSQVPGMLPVPGQYPHPPGPVYAPFHAQFLAGTTPPHAATAASHYAAGYGGTGGPVGAEDRDRSGGGSGYGYPTVTSTAAPTPSAPLMTNTSLPSTPSETPLTRSPEASPPAPLPGSQHARAPSWGSTPSPEPDGKTGRGSDAPADLSPHLAEFKLKWDIRGEQLKELPRPPWLQEQAFASGKKQCTVIVLTGPETQAEPWAVEVPRRADGRALAVADVVAALDAWLWAVVGDDAFGGHERAQAARDVLGFRHFGMTDKNNNRLRNVDHFSDDRAYFLGLDEVVEKNGASTLFFCVGAAPLA